MTKEEVKEKIAKMIMEEYDLRPSQAKKDVEEFFENLDKKYSVSHEVCEGDS